MSLRHSRENTNTPCRIYTSRHTIKTLLSNALETNFYKLWTNAEERPGIKQSQAWTSAADLYFWTNPCVQKKFQATFHRAETTLAWRTLTSLTSILIQHFNQELIRLIFLTAVWEGNGPPGDIKWNATSTTLFPPHTGSNISFLKSPYSFYFPTCEPHLWIFSNTSAQILHFLAQDFHKHPDWMLFLYDFNISSMRSY